MSTIHSKIIRFTRQWRIRLISLAIITFLVSSTILSWMAVVAEIRLLTLSFVLGIIAFVTFWFVFQVFPGHHQTIRLLDEQFPDLEYSSQLLQLVDLQGLPAIQQHKTIDRLLSQVYKLHYPLPGSMVIFVAGLTVIAAFVFIWLKPEKIVEASVMPSLSVVDSLAMEAEADSLFLTNMEIKVIPPSYTGLTSYQVKNPDPIIPEGSQVNIKAAFSLEPDISVLEFANGRASGSQVASEWVFSFTITEKVLYRLTASSSGLTFESPYHVLDIKKDLSPEIRLADMPQYQRFDYDESPAVEVTTTLSDDYGLTDGYILATITQGSGESVRFREQRVNFDKPVSGKSGQWTQLLKASDFNMEPGNELYFHVVAIDNRQPEPQISRSETYFFAINDTSEVEFSLAGNLGVDIMPDYFRSQLQLILDTEKLIKEKPSLSRLAFNFTSNELGYDQKQLRLRYGQFMGEEEDSALEVEQEEPLEEENAHEHAGEVNVLQEFGHDHDHENEAGQWQDRGTDPGHSHGHDHEANGNQNENPLEAYLHNHEDAETATFFTVTLKAKLRAALNQMWDAELYLRLFQPENSLVYQYEALKLLKEIKNHARIYVQRVGFEPTPINEGKTRLTKKPEDTNQKPTSAAFESDDQWSAVKQLAGALAVLAPDQIPKSYWQLAARELAVVVVESPIEFLDLLNAINWLGQQTSYSEEDQLAIRSLQSRLLELVQKESKQPMLQTRTSQELEAAFIDQLTLEDR